MIRAVPDKCGEPGPGPAVCELEPDHDGMCTDKTQLLRWWRIAPEPVGPPDADDDDTELELPLAWLQQKIVSVVVQARPLPLRGRLVLVEYAPLSGDPCVLHVRTRSGVVLVPWRAVLEVSLPR